MEREEEVAVCRSAGTIRGGSYIITGARSSPAAYPTEGVQQAVLRDVLSTIRMLNWTPGHCVLAQTPPFAIGNVLPAGPVNTASSWDGKGHEGAYACRVAAHSQRRWDVDVRWSDLKPNLIRGLLYLPEPPCPAIFDEGACIPRHDRIVKLGS